MGAPGAAVLLLWGSSTLGLRSCAASLLTTEVWEAGLLILHGSEEGWSPLPRSPGTQVLEEVAAMQSLSSFCRGLLQVALQRKGQAPEEDEDTETR